MILLHDHHGIRCEICHDRGMMILHDHHENRLAIRRDHHEMMIHCVRRETHCVILRDHDRRCEIRHGHRVYDFGRPLRRYHHRVDRYPEDRALRVRQSRGSLRPDLDHRQTMSDSTEPILIGVACVHANDLPERRLLNRRDLRLQIRRNCRPNHLLVLIPFQTWSLVLMFWVYVGDDVEAAPRNRLPMRG